MKKGFKCTSILLVVLAINLLVISSLAKFSNYPEKCLVRSRAALSSIVQETD